MAKRINLEGETGGGLGAQSLMANDKQLPEMVLTFQIFYLQTSFTKQPIGLVSISDMCLMNLMNHIPETSFLMYSQTNKNTS